MFEAVRKIAIRYLDNDDPLPVVDESASFWFRRFATSLSIGNGAGLLATSGLLQTNQDYIGLLSQPFGWFALGTITAGVLPLFLGVRTWLKKPRPGLKQSPTKDNVPELYDHKMPIALYIAHNAATKFYILATAISATLFIIGLYSAWDAMDRQRQQQIEPAPLLLEQPGESTVDRTASAPDDTEF